MPKRSGFTLIEVLVVIAVVALLMAILLPTPQRVKRQTRAAACQSNPKQWSTVFNMVSATTACWPGRNTDISGRLVALGLGQRYRYTAQIRRRQDLVPLRLHELDAPFLHQQA